MLVIEKKKQICYVQEKERQHRYQSIVAWTVSLQARCTLCIRKIIVTAVVTIIVFLWLVIVFAKGPIRCCDELHL